MSKFGNTGLMVGRHFTIFIKKLFRLLFDYIFYLIRSLFILIIANELKEITIKGLRSQSELNKKCK